MKFAIDQKTFALALGRCAAIACNRPTLPSLHGVLLEPCAGLLKISANDLETAYTTAVNGIIWDGAMAENVRIVLPAKKLHEIVKAIPSGEVAIDYDPSSLRAIISGGTASFTLSGLDPLEYPNLPEVAGESFDLDAHALVKILQSVEYAQSGDDTRYNLCGCLLKIEKNNEDDLFLTAVSTDGHRLAIDSVPLPGDPRPVPADLTKGVIVPSKGVAEICKISGGGILVISIAGNNLRIATDNDFLYLRLIDGEFPDYNRVIPTNLDKRIEIKRPALIAALQRVQLMTEKKFRGISLATGDGIITLAADLAEIGGHAEDRVTAMVPDEAITLRVNAQYLLQTLETMSSGAVEISLKDELTPLRVNPLGTDEPLAIIMPMRL